MPQKIVKPLTFLFEADGISFPNNPTLPVLIYRQVFSAELASKADRFEKIYSQNDWVGCWRWSVYDFQHFHCNAHEALAVAQGNAQLQLGGPQGRSFQVYAGDVIVLPAGTGHMNLGCSQDFMVVGAYPSGQGNYETNGGNPDEYAKAVDKIAATTLPSTDPIYGKNGPLAHLWIGSHTNSLE